MHRIAAESVTLRSPGAIRGLGDERSQRRWQTTPLPRLYACLPRCAPERRFPASRRASQARTSRSARDGSQERSGSALGSAWCVHGTTPSGLHPAWSESRNLLKSLEAKLSAHRVVFFRNSGPSWDHRGFSTVGDLRRARPLFNYRGGVRAVNLLRVHCVILMVQCNVSYPVTRCTAERPSARTTSSLFPAWETNAPSVFTPTPDSEAKSRVRAAVS